jgi:tetratricopeptide (TPR) repeat protein
MEALGNLASSYGDMGDIKAALEGIDITLEINPSNSMMRFYRFQNLDRLGKEDEALESLRIGLEKDPNNFLNMHALVMYYSFKKDQKNALLNLNKLKTARKEDNRINRSELLFNYIFGNAQVGIDAYQKLKNPRNQEKIIALYLHKKLGNKNKSDELIEELETFHLDQYNDNKGGKYATNILSRINAVKGEVTSSLEWMRKSINLGERSYKSFQAFPEFKKMRKDPRFLELLDRMEDLVQIERMKIQNNI